VAEAAFDAVLVCETLDHALDPARVLHEARRALRPGGLLAVLQSVHVERENPPLAVRLRVAAGRARARLAGTLPLDDAATKMHGFTGAALRELVAGVFTVEDAVLRGGSLFLRARAAP
jgi:SAM-dependent methyltransferase